VEAKLAELKRRLIEVNSLQMARAVLYWDQSTYMPPGGATARARTMATLSQVAHEKFTDDAIGHLLDDLKAYGESLPYDSDDAALIRVTRREYDRETRLPASFVAEQANHYGLLYSAWQKARPANDFAGIRSLLEKTLDISRQFSSYYPAGTHVADPLIGIGDPGITAEDIKTLFAALRAEVVPLLNAIMAQPEVDSSFLNRHYPQDKQLAFGLQVVGDYGYDFNRGRQDLTYHPFLAKFAIGDSRITTRVREDNLGTALFGTMHEFGHAVYEQGINPDLDGTLLANGTSYAVHESQSRLWENLVGRSEGFWKHYYPKLQAQFPEQLSDVSADAFTRAINKVRRSLIRVEADEVTYNLHIMLRFDLELAMLEGSLEVRHLPEAWNARYRDDLGVVAPDDRDGVLQDVHWYAHKIGGSFQSYTLGNILSAQFFDKALEVNPQIPAEIEQGQFGTLHTWLRENIYHHGAKFTTNELLDRVGIGQMSIEPYLRYLKGKYQGLYGLS
jgi:carboxypeptidase Taq